MSAAPPPPRQSTSTTSSTTTSNRPPAKPSSSSSGPPPPKPPTTLHPTSLIGESVTLIGTHPVTISAGAIIHPRVRINTTYGPVWIGEGVVVGAKSVVGLT